MKQLLLLILSIFMVSTVMSQERINPKRGCRFEGNEPTGFNEDETLFAYSSTPEAEEIVNKILAVVYSSMRESRFVIRAASVPNAEAVVDGDKRLILYNADFMLRAGQQGNWVSTFILAHEIGHHVLGHTLSAEGSRQEDELEADKWAGSIMCGLGATLDEAQLGIKTMIKDGPARPGSTHPTKSARIQAVAVGFALARCKAGGNPEVTKSKDADGDGFADNVDDCPSEFGKLKGCPGSPAITDSDNDGVPDTGDDCKNIYGLKKFSGCPDTDGDNIPDKDDHCPNGKGVWGNKGCPEKASDQPDFIPMVYVSGGTFTMGCTTEQGSFCSERERPSHSVTLGNYWIGKYEVTQSQWKEIMGTNPSYFKDFDNCPVENVSWDDIQDFLKKLNQRYPGRNYRLPTEAEWEYAARGGNKRDGTKYSGSNTIDNVGWYSGNSGSKTHPVGGQSPNGLGIYDMCGNVWEWCSDWFGAYSASAQTNPQGPSTGFFRVLRGGGWDYKQEDMRCSYRYDFSSDYRSRGGGFRVVGLL